VRCLSHPEEGDQLQAGEILVTSQINIGRSCKSGWFQRYCGNTHARNKLTLEAGCKVAPTEEGIKKEEARREGAWLPEEKNMRWVL